MKKNPKCDEDYSNFFNMLKFWIKQTNNNIENVGSRVNLREIQEENVDRAIEEFTNPQFEPAFLKYRDFSIRISFFRTGKYNGEKVNFIVWKPEENQSWWLNVRYSYVEKSVNASYRSEIDYNKDSPRFKEYMKSSEFDNGLGFLISELEIDSETPNDKVKELFDYFCEMIDFAKQYYKAGESNLKIQELVNKLEQSYNIILRGAPGTGKTHLAKAVAARLIGITPDELVKSNQFEFVQFHPSYDYTDFVEGLRPIQSNGQVGFEPKNGTFKEFCNTAKLRQDSCFDKFEDIWERFIDNVDENFKVVIPPLQDGQEQTYSLNSNRSLKNETTKSGDYSITKENIFRVWQGKKGRKSGGHQSYMKAIVSFLEDDYNLPKYDDRSNLSCSNTNDKKYVFVIDEINRGEISKIFGELFFSIDPDYRGTKGAVSTQYANLFENEEKFYIPENVYVIGTMNDIDRSVDTFDFAMRRRFTFEEITAKDSQIMLSDDNVKQRMSRLNDAIISSEVGLTTDYQIGGSYFRSLNDGKVDENELWNSKLKPLLKDYFRGERNADKKIEVLENAYMGNANDSVER